MTYPKHLKLHALSSALDAGGAAGTGSAQLQPVSAPVFLKNWPKTTGLLDAAQQPFKWIWAMVRSIILRIARLFGVRADVPQEPPREMEAAATLSATAAPGQEAEAARKVADASALAAAQSNAFLEQVQQSLPDADRLKGIGASEFLSDVLTNLGTRMLVLGREVEAARQELLAQAAPVAAELGLDVNALLQQLEAGAAGGATAAVQPLWHDLVAKRAELTQLRATFCSYCIAALRGPAGPEQAAVNEVAQKSMATWADDAMRDRISQGVSAPSEDGAVDLAGFGEAASHQAPQSSPAAATQPAGGSAAAFSALMKRLREQPGLLDEPNADGIDSAPDDSQAPRPRPAAG